MDDATPTRTRTFDDGPLDGVTEPLDGPCREYLPPDRTPVREGSVDWTIGADGITHYAPVYGRECGTPRRAKSVRYIWCGPDASQEDPS